MRRRNRDHGGTMDDTGEFELLEGQRGLVGEHGPVGEPGLTMSPEQAAEIMAMVEEHRPPPVVRKVPTLSTRTLFLLSLLFFLATILLEKFSS
jgi:hypothetical protein